MPQNKWKMIERRRCLPYGIWHCRDGRKVLFSRRYIPLVQQSSDGKITEADPKERFDFTDQKWFYNDATPEKEKQIAAIKALSEWGLDERDIHKLFQDKNYTSAGYGRFRTRWGGFERRTSGS
jgi:hypothetical protein